MSISDNEKIRWPDLSQYGIYLAYTSISGAYEKLLFVDLYGRGDVDKLALANIKKVDWSFDHYKDIYFLDTLERKFKPNVVARAFGISDKCPMSTKFTREEILKNFYRAYTQKAKQNAKEIIQSSIPLGVNYSGETVFQTENIRYIKIDDDHYVTNDGSPNQPYFLLAVNEWGELDYSLIGKCLVHTAKTILQGNRITSKDLEKLGCIILDKKELNDHDYYRIQESLETVLYETFSLVVEDINDEQAFPIALNAFLASPKREIKISNTMSLGQYSTPLPMSYVAQYVLNKAIELKGEPTEQSVLEPTIGNGGLVTLLSKNENLDIYGFEIDPNRINQFNGINVKIGDATTVELTTLNENKKYNYTISNPPFGKLPKKVLFNEEVAIHRLDYLIALKTLQSRKNDGYSVFILNADRFSKGEISSGSHYFYNYLYDNYEIDDLIELSANLYQKNGANTSVRILLVGNKLDNPINQKGLRTPKKINVISNYSDLQMWSHMIVNKMENRIRDFSINDDVKIQTTPLEETQIKKQKSSFIGELNQTLSLFDFEDEIDTSNNTFQKKNNQQLETKTNILSKIRIPDPKDKEDLKNQKVKAKSFIEDIKLRKANELQAPYQSASKISEATSMIPINMASATYQALQNIQDKYSDIDNYVCQKLQYKSVEELGEIFSAEQIDALALAIFSHEEKNRAIINADQTGMGKGRFVAGMMRYAKLSGQTPVFITYKPALMSDIFRDINDIKSKDIFQDIFVINNVPIEDIFDPENPLFKPMPLKNHKEIISSQEIPEGTDIILATYSQINKKFSQSPKAKFLQQISNNAMFFLDESHISAGDSNINENMSAILKEAKGCVFSSATALKTIKSFKLYQSVFPESIHSDTLSDVLQIGGEGLQEALSNALAEDGVLIRREQDLSNVTIRDFNSSEETTFENKKLSDQVAEILAMMTVLSNEVSKEVTKLNKKFLEQYENLSDEAKESKGRMQASSMNFASRLYNTTRQFLLALQVDQAIEQALSDLKNNIKPVIGVENTGESLIINLINSKIFDSEQLQKFEVLNERSKFSLSETEKAEFINLMNIRAEKLENFYFEEIPQFKDYLSLVLKKLQTISVKDAYGFSSEKILDEESYNVLEEQIQERIDNLPNTLPLIPLDYIKESLKEQGYLTGEVSGRNIRLRPKEIEIIDDNNQKSVKKVWTIDSNFTFNVTQTITGFQNGEYDSIIITKAGSTGYSMHASPRFKDPRQRDFILLQKASNIAEYLQWLGRVNRKDQIIAPIVTNLNTGLPAELRLTMMHNSKLRQLSANVTSNRENNNITNENVDFLNHVGNDIAMSYLIANLELARRLNIALPNENNGNIANVDNYYINKLMSRLVLLVTEEQETIINDLSILFTNKMAELDAKSENPFKVKVHDWNAKTVDSYKLESYVGKDTGSAFDKPIELVTLQFNVKQNPLSFEQIDKIVSEYQEKYADGSEFDHLLTDQLSQNLSRISKIIKLTNAIRSEMLERCFNYLPKKMQKKIGSHLSLGKFVDELSENPKYETQLETYKLALSAVELQKLDVGTFFNVIDDLGEIKPARVIGYMLPEKKSDIAHSARIGIEAIIAGDNKPTKLNLMRLHTYRQILTEKNLKLELGENGADSFQKEIQRISNSTLPKQVRVMKNNLFKATELAIENRMGSPILYTDESGLRQRAILLNNNSSFSLLNEIPIKMNAESLLSYIEEYFKNNEKNVSPIFRSQMTKNSRVPLNIEFRFKSAEKGTFIIHDMKKYEHYKLIEDNSIFVINNKFNEFGGLNIQLTGTNKEMKCEVETSKIAEFMRLLHKNHKLNGLYLMNAEREVIQSLRKKIGRDKNIDQEMII